MAQALEFVAVDIETTGFAVSDEITVVGLVLPLGCRLFCQRTPGAASEASLEDRLQERAGTHVALSLHDSETALLEAVGTFAGERLRDDDLLLVAYNGETFRGGFDLPFLRTRLARTGVAWPFSDLPYADLMPVLCNRFNTAITGADTAEDGDDANADPDPDQPTIEEQSELPAVYDVLVGGDAGALDPFEDSAAAVRVFQDGDLEALLLHNLSDILRTQALGELAQQYCSTSDFQLKSLTPTIKAFDEAAADGSGVGGGSIGGDHSHPS